MLKRFALFLLPFFMGLLPASADLVNGDFEDGTLNGWSLHVYEYNDLGSIPSVVSYDATVQTGRYRDSLAAYFRGSVLAEEADSAGQVWIEFSQIFEAQAGQSLQFDNFSTWSGDPFAVTAFYSLSLAGSGTVWSGAMLLFEDDGLSTTWTSLSSGALTESGQYELFFQFEVYAGGPLAESEFKLDLDNIRLVPEPTSIALWGLAGIILACVRRVRA